MYKSHMRKPDELDSMIAADKLLQDFDNSKWSYSATERMARRAGELVLSALGSLGQSFMPLAAGEIARQYDAEA